MKITFQLARITAGVILLQTLFYKFSGAAVSIHIFTTLGIEPYGRIGSGVIELIAGILLLIPSQSWKGAFLGLGTMAGAIASHLLFLGVEVLGDGGKLFASAVVVLVCCVLVMIVQKDDILKFANKNLGISI